MLQLRNLVSFGPALKRAGPTKFAGDDISFPRKRNELRKARSGTHRFALVIAIFKVAAQVSKEPLLSSSICWVEVYFQGRAFRSACVREGVVLEPVDHECFSRGNHNLPAFHRHE